jgi:hypothetical protein
MEVLMAMTLIAVGGAGVISMQKVTIQGGEDARRFDMATNIANEWVSRLQRDSAFWTRPNSDFPDTININQTRWLNSANDVFVTPPMPTAPADGLSPAFDMFGRDVIPGTGIDVWYCVQYRLTWLSKPSAGASPWAPPLNISSLLRAEVRVYYNRLEAAPLGNCTSPPADALPAAPAVSPFHMVYATTAIRQQGRR